MQRGKAIFQSIFKRLAAINPPLNSSRGIKDIKKTASSLEIPSNIDVKKVTKELPIKILL
jgi:hypothetical protein